MMKLRDGSTVHFVFPDEITSGASLVMLRQFPGGERHPTVYMLRVVCVDVVELDGAGSSVVVNGSIRGRPLVDACQAFVTAWERTPGEDRPREAAELVRALTSTLGIIKGVGEERAEPDTYLRLQAEARNVVRAMQEVATRPLLLGRAFVQLAYVLGMPAP